MSTPDRIYFKGLDSLRAIGALSVILGHIELTKSGMGIASLMHIPFYSYTSGHIGVMLFFVLSGFLITFLLLKERETFGVVYLRNFYIRRALRIWPIYYLALALLVLVIPFAVQMDYFSKPDMGNWTLLLQAIAIYALMVPNFVAFGIPGIGGGFHLGSIGTEEQFYLIWPLILKWFKNILVPILLILFIIPLMPHFCDFVAFRFLNPESSTHLFMKQLGTFFTFFKISCMAMGGLAALIFHGKMDSIIRFLYSVPVQLIALIVGFGGWLIGFHVSQFNDELYALFFAIVILNTSTNPKALLSFDYKITNYLGKISYGIYVYHWMIIYLVMDKLILLKLNPTLFNVLLYTITIGLTIGISHLSYFHFELWFLKFKERFTIIRSYQQHGK